MIEASGVAEVIAETIAGPCTGPVPLRGLPAAYQKARGGLRFEFLRRTTSVLSILFQSDTRACFQWLPLLLVVLLQLEINK